MPNVIDTPDCCNEEEEANWWHTNQARLQAAFQQAEREGTLLLGNPTASPISAEGAPKAGEISQNEQT